MDDNRSIYQRRRQAFMSKISGGAAIFASAKMCKGKFRQDSNFFYLTGFKEPEAVLVLAPEHPEHKFVLFVRPRDRDQERWTGKRAGIEGAKEEYFADAAYPVSEIGDVLPKYFENVEKIYYRMGEDEDLDNKVLEILRRFRAKRYESCSGPVSIVDPTEIVYNMRAIKDPYEIELIRKAAEISCSAHISAMKSLKPGMHEYELQALIEYIFVKSGAEGPAYPTIVGSGPNATYLHYDANNCIIRDGDLIVIDAGAEYGHYSADITRTIPANGKFSDIQRQLYNIVLSAQTSAIEEIRPGAKIDAPHERAVQVIVSGLISIGLLEGDQDKIIEEKGYKEFYMHNTGHPLGLDTHDVGRRKIGNETIAFEPGMVVTVEPGIYIPQDMDQVDEKYRGIGIRIEDDVLVTEDGHEVLTEKVPKCIEDIETTMSRKILSMRI